MTTNDFQPEAPTDPTESLVRQQFESAVAGLHLDVPSLVRTGTAAGRQLSRRRRLQQAGAGVASVAVLAAAGLLGLHGGLFDSNAGAPADHGTIGESVPSTPRALAAALIADLPSGVQALSQGGALVQGKALEADLRLSDGHHEVSLGVGATRLHVFPTACAHLGTGPCQARTLPDGSRLVIAENIEGTQGHRSLFVVLTRSNDAVIAFEYAKVAGGQEALLLSSSQLVEMLRNPLVGMQTSQAMAEAGQQLPSFTREAALLGMSASTSLHASSSSSSSATAPSYPDVSPSHHSAHLPPPTRVGPRPAGSTAQTVAPPPARRGP